MQGRTAHSHWDRIVDAHESNEIQFHTDHSSRRPWQVKNASFWGGRKLKNKVDLGYVGGWGVCPTGKSISVSVAVQCVCACVRACVRAKLCAGVRTMIPPGLGRNIGSLWGVVPGRAVPCRPGARPPPALSKIENETLVLSGSDRIRTRSYSRGVFPMGFRPQKSSKFRVFFRSLPALTPRLRSSRWCLLVP